MTEKYKPVTQEMLDWAANYPQPLWLPQSLVPAFEFAREAHKNQFRKYTGDPYIVHPLDVAHRMLEGIYAVSSSAASQLNLMHEMEHVIVACLLHDVVEDCGVSLTTIEKLFGCDVAEAVFWVTDTLTNEQGNRATRKRLEAIRISHAPVHVRCLKLCDIASNTLSIVEHDPDFSVVYIREKQFLMSMISEFDEDHEDRMVIALFYALAVRAIAKL